ncbi:MAG: prepilin peptidase [Cellulosilyticaceae bacterium]
MMFAFILMIFILGIIIGSFLNVCIYRIPNNERIDFPPSNCQSCKHRLGVLDLVPVISYVALRGKCKYCGDKVSMQYPLVELANGVGYVLAFLHFGISFQTLLAFAFISFVIVLTMIDAAHMILPTSIIVTGSIIAVALQVAISIENNDWMILINALIAGAIGYGVIALVFYLSFILLKKEGMGYGDVRYIGMIGLFTSPSLVFLTLLIGSIVGSIYGGVIYMRNKESVQFPFGPFLSIGGIISFFYGQVIITTYTEWVMSQLL